MSPMLPVDDFAYLGGADAEFGPERLHADAALRVSAAYLPNLLIGQLRPSMPGASRLSSLGPHIGQVLLEGAKEEMVRSDADGIVAVMAAEKTFGNGAIVEFPGEAVRRHPAPPAAHVHLTVPAPAQWPLPFPAGEQVIVPRDPGPEVFGASRGLAALGTGAGAILARLLARSEEAATAVLTDARDTLDRHRNSPFDAQPPDDFHSPRGHFYA
jgi:hypothetical protein